MPTPSTLDRARDLFARQAWSEAYAHLSTVDHESGLEPEDIERLVDPVLSHRLLVTHTYGLAGETPDEQAGLLERCLERAPRPGTVAAGPPARP